MAAAATAAVDALSSPPTAAQDGLFFSDGGGGGVGTRRRQLGEAVGAAAAAAGDVRDAGATGAVGVEFSAKGCLMAVALADGTVLLTRIDRYTSGVRYKPAGSIIVALFAHSILLGLCIRILKRCEL